MNKAFKKVKFTEERLGCLAYQVYKKSDFTFYQRDNESQNYYVDMLNNGDIQNLYEMYNVINWLESWLDGNKIMTTKKDIFNSMIEEHIFNSGLLQVDDYIYATLEFNDVIDGQIFSTNDDGFMIDDNISGDIFYVYSKEIKIINEYRSKHTYRN